MSSQLSGLPPSNDEATSLDTAAYIGELVAELARLASGCDLQLVAYFLEMARMECEIELRKGGGPTKMLGRF